MQAACRMTAEDTVHVDPNPGRSLMDMVPRTLTTTVFFTVNGKVPTRRVLLALVDSEMEEMTDEKWSALQQEIEMERKLETEYALQHRIETANECPPPSTRFTIHETFRFSWDPSHTLYVASCVCRQLPQSRRELRREGLIKGHRNEGRKPRQKYRNRRPAMWE